MVKNKVIQEPKQLTEFQKKLKIALLELCDEGFFDDCIQQRREKLV